MAKTWFITGAARGMGIEFAKAALKAGENVVATARDPRKVEEALGRSDRLLAIALDVTQEAQADAVEWAQVVLREKQTEIDQWRHLSVSTDGTWKDVDHKKLVS